MQKKLLLISNSISKDGGYLDHVFPAIKKIIKDKKQILFIPFALKNWGKYEDIAQNRFHQEGLVLQSIHHKKDYKKSIKEAEVIFIGGGNTFRLLKKLYDFDLIDVIKSRVNLGKLIYIGVSAGANVACPTIQTTNDMPIVAVPELVALSLIPFQINPHYIDSELDKLNKIETRDERIGQYHEENNLSVVGLREGSYLLLNNGKLKLEGKTGGKLFIKDKEPKSLRPKGFLNYLL